MIRADYSPNITSISASGEKVNPKLNGDILTGVRSRVPFYPEYLCRGVFSFIIVPYCNRDQGTEFMEVTAVKKMIAMVLCLVLILSLTGCGGIKHPSVQEYAAGQGNIRGNVDTDAYYERDERFEIGATKEGYAVFKDPEAAYQALLEKYSDGLSLIQTEFDLQSVSQKEYQMYKAYGWQVTGGTAEAQEQAQFVTSFFDIYENSFN